MTTTDLTNSLCQELLQKHLAGWRLSPDEFQLLEDRGHLALNGPKLVVTDAGNDLLGTPQAS